MTNRKGFGPESAAPRHSEEATRQPGPAARRALAEAERRRAKRRAEETGKAAPAKEIDGVDGPEPVRYGDWENKGRASDF